MSRQPPLPLRHDLAQRVEQLLPEMPEVPPLEPDEVDDLVRIARALATGSQGRGLGPDVCSRLYAELRGIVGILSAASSEDQAGSPSPPPPPARPRTASSSRSRRNGFLAP